MLALRYVYVLALVTWLGGMLTLGAVVAPTIFQVLQQETPSDGRALAGAAFGAMIARFHYVAYGGAALMLVALAGMALLGPRPRHFAIRSALVGAMLAVALYSGFVVLPQIDAIQREAGVLPSRLPASDSRRITFDGLHELSTRLMMVNIAAAFILLFWEAREHS
jgi:uncharacterized membrane protein